MNVMTLSLAQAREIIAGARAAGTRAASSP